MEEYVQTQEQNRLKTIPEDSALGSEASFRRKSRSPPHPSSTPVPDDRISFEPESKSKRSSWDAVSLKSVESNPVSVRTGSSILPQLPASSRINESPKDLNDRFVQRTQSPGHVVSDDSADNYLPAEAGHAPKVSIRPSSTETKLVPGPIAVTGSAGSSDGVKPLLSPTAQSPKESSELKPMIRAPNTSRRRKKFLEQRERQLRHEYDAKSMYIFYLPQLFQC